MDCFPKSTLTFLRQLKRNNEREWFNANKSKYEANVLEPALEFITEMQKPIGKISSHFNVVPKRVGGSLMRVYRDTRFSKNKQPYKTNVGIQFRHELGKDVHAPGFYVHIEPGRVFLGAGLWHPESGALKKIRDFIVDNPSAFKKAINSKKFKEAFKLGGESLKRPPRGYDPEHAHIEHLKRKDFIAVKELKAGRPFEPGFTKEVSDSFKTVTPLMRYLCEALDVAF